MLTDIKWDKVGHMGMPPEFAAMLGDVMPNQVSTGIYKDAGFNSRGLSSQIDSNDYDNNHYGVADNVEQIIKKFPSINDEDGKYIIAYQRLSRDEEPQDGGWRWHKWGEYIGDKEPQCEYLAHEPEIESIIVFNVFKLVN